MLCLPAEPNFNLAMPPIHPLRSYYWSLPSPALAVCPRPFPQDRRVLHTFFHHATTYRVHSWPWRKEGSHTVHVAVEVRMHVCEKQSCCKSPGNELIGIATAAVAHRWFEDLRLAALGWGRHRLPKKEVTAAATHLPTGYTGERADTRGRCFNLLLDGTSSNDQRHGPEPCNRQGTGNVAAPHGLCREICGNESPKLTE